MAEQYPEKLKDGVQSISGEPPYYELLKIYSLTYGVAFYFLPYDFKLTETFDIRWNQQTVFGRMDPIATYKGMGRSMNLSFKARQKERDGSSPITFTPDELLHSIDHLKKCLYPRYNSSQVMISPPLFRMQYKNLINAGQEQFEIKPENGVLSIITGFTANFMSEPNKIAFPNSLTNDGKSDKSMAYPKVFDINITFTVLNENLVATQQTNILTNEYFYKYKHEHTHAGVGQAPSTEQNASEGQSTNEQANAVAGAVLGSS